MKREMFILVGETCAGKTTIASILQNEGYKLVKSYTTKTKRPGEENSYYYINEKKFKEMQNSGKLVNVTNANGNYYGTCPDDIDNCDLWIIDPNGVDWCIENQDKYLAGRNVLVFYITLGSEARRKRALERGDDMMKFTKRDNIEDRIFGKFYEQEKFDFLLNNTNSKESVGRIKSFAKLKFGEIND